MPETVEFTIQLPVYPERVYRAWMDSAEHSRITGSLAEIDPRVGGRFSILDGRVFGQFIALTPFDRIAQTWEMLEFPSRASRIELTLEPTCLGAELHLVHTGIPEGKSRAVLQWWETVYLRPLQAYFDSWVGETVADMGNG